MNVSVAGKILINGAIRPRDVVIIHTWTYIHIPRDRDKVNIVSCVLASLATGLSDGDLESSITGVPSVFSFSRLATRRSDSKECRQTDRIRHSVED